MKNTLPLLLLLSLLQFANATVIASADFTGMTVSDQVTVAPVEGANDFNWTLIQTATTNFDVVEDDGTPGIGSGNALRIDNSGTGTFRGMIGTMDGAADLLVGDTITLTFKGRYYEEPANNGGGLRFGFINPESLDNNFYLQVGTGGNTGLALFRDVPNDSSPGAGAGPVAIPSTASGPAYASLAMEPFEAFFSITRSAESEYTLVASVNGSTRTATSTTGWNTYDAIFIRNGGIAADFLVDDISVALETSMEELYWDGTGSSWPEAASWSVVPDAATPDPDAAPDAAITAVFGIEGLAGDQTVNLNGDQSVGGMRFASPVYITVQGGGTDHVLRIGSAGITVGAEAFAPVIGSAMAGQKVAIQLDGSQVWAQNQFLDEMRILNDIDGQGASLTFAGDGNTLLGGNVSALSLLRFNQAGDMTVEGDVADITNVSFTGGGWVDFDGMLEASGTILVDRVASYALEGGISGTASLHKRGTGVLFLDGESTHTGPGLLDAGIVEIGGNSSAANGGWTLRGYGPAGATFNTVATTLEIAEGASLGVAATATLQAGNSAPNGGFQQQTIQSGGSVVVDGTLLIGRSGTLNVAGGTWTQNGDATIATQGGGLATVNVLAGGQYIATHATPTILGTSESINTLTRFNILGGTATTGVAFHNSTPATVENAYSEVRIGQGGTLRLSADVASILTTVGGGIRFELAGGDGTIDTNGHSTAIEVPVHGEGNLIKDGPGTLATTQANTYTGDTSVLAGTLSLAAPSLADDSMVTVAAGAMLRLDFTGEDRVAGLVLGGTALPEGTYDAASHPAFLTGDGKLVVAGVPDDTFAAWAAELGLSGDPAEDFDHDGLADALEFVLGTDPKAPDAGDVLTIDEDAEHFIIAFIRDHRSKTPDVTLTVETGNDLAGWPRVFIVGDATESSSEGVTVLDNGDATDTITVRIAKLGAPSLFARVNVQIAAEP